MSRRLYTLCGADPDCRFSPHCWKVVMALAHKGLDFEDVPTPFTAIPGIEGGFSRTVPVLSDNGRLLRDSFQIALYLEETYSARPSLFRGEGGMALSRFIEGYSQRLVHTSLMRIILKDIHDRLAPADQAYFRESREKLLGMTLEDVDARADAELEVLGDRLGPMRHLLKYQPFLGGEGPLFADYILFGAFQWARVSSPKPLLRTGDVVHDWFERCLDLHDGRGRAMKAAA